LCAQTHLGIWRIAGGGLVLALPGEAKKLAVVAAPLLIARADVLSRAPAGQLVLPVARGAGRLLRRAQGRFAQPCVLAGAAGWITGLRADRSAHRERVGLVAADPGRGILKLSPLDDWTREAARTYAAAHGVPTNPLHEKGFASIGCAPCTRASRPGEPERAGRWWWEDESKKECGLHIAAGAVR
jgi:Phosphoadenosine phosphosulfate reductase family